MFNLLCCYISKPSGFRRQVKLLRVIFRCHRLRKFTVSRFTENVLNILNIFQRCRAKTNLKMLILPPAISQYPNHLAKLLGILPFKSHNEFFLTFSYQCIFRDRMDGFFYYCCYCNILSLMQLGSSCNVLLCVGFNKIFVIISCIFTPCFNSC